jgi:peptidoglycan/LPS O-acetylase OafA/YrhL
MGVIRILLALSVVSAHVGAPSGASWLRLSGGRMAVQVFFVISGFYMSLILRDKYRGRGGYQKFILNRFLRLWPIYFIVICMTVGASMLLHWRVGYHLFPVENWAQDWHRFSPVTAFVFIFSNLLMVGQDLITFLAVDPNGGGLFFTKNFYGESFPMFHYSLCQPAWSLGVELSFYAVAPLLVTKRARVLAVVCAMSVGVHYLIAFVARVPDDPWNYRFFPSEISVFLMGAIAHQFYERLADRDLIKPQVSRAVFWSAVASILMYSKLPFQNGYLPMQSFCALFALAVPWLFHFTRNSKRDRLIGELSYPLYVCHWFVACAMVCPRWPWLKAHYAESVIVVSFLLAIALWRFVAVPIDRLREKIARSLVWNPHEIDVREPMYPPAA